MADNQDPKNSDPKQSDPPENPPTESDAEEKYWKTFEGKLDSWFDRKLKTMREQGASRTGGRSTLPKVIASIMGGPFTPND